MASVVENTSHRHRMREMDLLFLYSQPSTFGSCDYTSYFYIIISFSLLAIGTVITIYALGGADNYILSNLGHMWLVGPIFMCSGVMVGVKSLLYLRRKSIIQKLLRQRVLLRVCHCTAVGNPGASGVLLSLQEIAQQSRHYQQQQDGYIVRNASTTTLPPAYEALVGANLAGSSETTGVNPSDAPPPTYDEAVFLIGDEKLKVILDEARASPQVFTEDATPSSSNKP